MSISRRSIGRLCRRSWISESSSSVLSAHTPILTTVSHLNKAWKHEQPVPEVEQQARTYLDKVSELLSKHATASPTWIFGPEVGPTALDAHTIVFIARLIDAKREHVIAENMLAYGKWALKGKEWMAVNEGRPTLHSV